MLVHGHQLQLLTTLPYHDYERYKVGDSPFVLALPEGVCVARQNCSPQLALQIDKQGSNQCAQILCSSPRACVACEHRRQRATSNQERRQSNNQSNQLCARVYVLFVGVWESLWSTTNTQVRSGRMHANVGCACECMRTQTHRC